MQPKDCVFRIYRDVRFANDKTPYKLYASAAFSPGGRKQNLPGYYLPPRRRRGARWRRPPPARQAQTRRRAASHRRNRPPSAWRAALEDERFVSIYGHVRGERNKKLPAELAAIANSPV